MKNFPLLAIHVSIALALATPVLFAQQEAAAETPAEGGGAQAQPDKQFHLLPLCRTVEVGAEVLHPNAQAWEPIEEGKFYPLGCAYRTTSEKARLSIQFGNGSEVSIEGTASFSTRGQPIGQKDRTIVLKGGTVKVVLPRSMPAGLFKVTCPGFVVTDLSGESTYTFEATGDGDVATVRCITGTLSLEGRHFRIPAMRAANEVRIRTSQDMLFTGLYGTSGDYIVNLDQGIVTVRDVETGAEKNEERKLDWHLSPQTTVRIHRAKPAIGERMSVTVMTFDETGALVNRCAFAEGRSELNTGEQGEKALAAKEESAKRAMENADAVTTEAAPEETSTEEEKETTKEESTEE